LALIDLHRSGFQGEVVYVTHISVHISALYFLLWGHHLRPIRFFVAFVVDCQFLVCVGPHQAGAAYMYGCGPAVVQPPSDEMD